MEQNKTALIVGMAKSGIGAAKLLARNGYHVRINDMKAEIPGLAEALCGAAVEYRLGEDPLTLLDGVDLVVPSPIIPMTAPFLVEAKRRGIEIESEIELGYRYAKADFVCITGTNGKTTCTALTGELFKAAGFRTFVLGNIGVAITEHAEETRPGDVIVAETAALQLEGCTRFHAHAAACCNITPDHLDHFGTMENYIAAKRKVFDNQTADDFAVLNYDDPVVRAMADCTPAETLYFSRKAMPENGMFVRDGMVVYSRHGAETPILPAKDIRIPGGHNLENAMLSSLLALACGVQPETVAEVLRTFPGVEHRIEFVRELDGVRYINDSKGTNVDSTIKAIQTMTRPTAIILGGYDKHCDFTPMVQEMLASPYIKEAVLIGATADQIERTCRENGYTHLHRAGTLKDAIDQCRALSSDGWNVLLSPACASFDMFSDYESRGRIFKELVRELK